MPDNDHQIITVKVTPKSSKSAIIGWQENVLKVRLSAVPEKGAANQELIRLFSKTYKIPKSSITIISGLTSRLKKLRLPSTVQFH